ncbi:MAG TPA: helix-turn-helix transcriptional regulator [Candidatus Saccharimonadales bacterium]|nr:helix-turn-helix transcriptional regulator [Candidatus Saccharimonadales bacterium]
MSRHETTTYSSDADEQYDSDEFRHDDPPEPPAAARAHVVLGARSEDGEVDEPDDADDEASESPHAPSTVRLTVPEQRGETEPDETAKVAGAAAVKGAAAEASSDAKHAEQQTAEAGQQQPVEDAARRAKKATGAAATPEDAPAAATESDTPSPAPAAGSGGGSDRTPPTDRPHGTAGESDGEEPDGSQSPSDRPQASETAGIAEYPVYEGPEARMMLHRHVTKTRETDIELESRLPEELQRPYALLLSNDLTLEQVAEQLDVSEDRVVDLASQIIGVARDIIQTLPEEQQAIGRVTGAQEIDEIRKDVGATQRALAGIAGITHGALQQFFRGEIFLPAEKIQAMLNFMDVPAGEAEMVMDTYEKDRGGHGREAVTGVLPHGRLIRQDIDTRQIAIETAGEAELQGIDLADVLTPRQRQVLEILRNPSLTRSEAAEAAGVVPHALSMTGRRIEAALKDALDAKREGTYRPAASSEPAGVGPELLARRNATAGVTRDTMADAMDVSPSYLDKVLRGEAYTDPDRIRRGALHVGMTPQQADEYAARFEAEFAPSQDYRDMRPAVIDALREKLKPAAPGQRARPQSDLARAAGVDLQQVERLLRGVSWIDPGQVHKLLAAAGYSEEEAAAHLEQYEADRDTREAAINFARRKQQRPSRRQD